MIEVKIESNAFDIHLFSIYECQYHTLRQLEMIREMG